MGPNLNEMCGLIQVTSGIEGLVYRCRFSPVFGKIGVLDARTFDPAKTKQMAHTTTTSRFNRCLSQSIVMFVVILAGILFSAVANAEKPDHKVKRSKTRHHKAIHANSNKACYILYKKRTDMPKHPLLAGLKRTKYKPMAETDQPARLVSSN